MWCTPEISKKLLGRGFVTRQNIPSSEHSIKASQVLGRARTEVMSQKSLSGTQKQPSRIWLAARYSGGSTSHTASELTAPGGYYSYVELNDFALLMLQ